ncbi:hypothetical protein F3Y22_tig00110194pilonHSYRG00167 [Hibiscus syriacus]|uniref:Uncharacterized protein n=1 Tax=Hibiscus syriacus TaxID=106335 RepID=A0A6A3BF65_HIBSY|nr:hypothetical protein F3Y22_tig00110194pilonHSYRG00167 [Hibiscus syriacus]
MIIHQFSPVTPKEGVSWWKRWTCSTWASNGLQNSEKSSPSRCIGEDGSEIVGLRHMRGNLHLFREGVFNELVQSLLPGHDLVLLDGEDKVTDRPCFTGDMGIRRHESPSYLSRPSKDLRDIDPDQDHGHPRSGMSNRSPSGKVLLRNRRLDLDPRERSDGDDYFGGPMQSGRFHEFATDGMLRGGGMVVGENCSSFRFCPEDDSELHERGNVRERDFDRRIKKRPGNAPPPRRARNIEEHEGNFRHGGQIWQGDGFKDMSQVKRKRF